MLLIPNKNKEKEDENIMAKFSLFMSSEENSDYIIDIINQISDLKDYKNVRLYRIFRQNKIY